MVYNFHGWSQWTVSFVRRFIICYQNILYFESISLNVWIFVLLVVLLQLSFLLILYSFTLYLLTLLFRTWKEKFSANFVETQVLSNINLQRSLSALTIFYSSSSIAHSHINYLFLAQIFKIIKLTHWTKYFINSNYVYFWLLTR